MEKTLEQIVEFNAVAKQHKQMIEEKGIRETKFTWACDKVSRVSTNKILDDYAEKQDNILRKYALEGRDGEILRNENGSYKLSKRGDEQATKELKNLWSEEREKTYEVTPYIATSLEGHDLTEIEKEILQGFVIE